MSSMLELFLLAFRVLEYALVLVSRIDINLSRSHINFRGSSFWRMLVC
jgi:hypothetical protein